MHGVKVEPLWLVDGGIGSMERVGSRAGETRSQCSAWHTNMLSLLLSSAPLNLSCLSPAQC